MFPDPTDPSSPKPVLDYHSSRGDKFVLLRRFSSPFEADLAKLTLESEGIQVNLVGAERQAVLGSYGAVSDGVDLLVLQADLEPALTIMQSIDAKRAARLAASQPKQACPLCGQPDGIKVDPRLFWFGLLLLGVAVAAMVSPWPPLVTRAIVIVFGIAGLLLIIVAGSRRICDRCGHRWSVWSSPDSPAKDGNEEDATDEKENS